MAYQVFARKWRPQTFQEVVGQGHITRTLENAIHSGRIAHAYLFGGPRGVGKTSVARILAKALNCQGRRDQRPCNECLPCVEITQGSSVDVHEIDGASNRGIDEIRELRDNIGYMPSSGKYRIYIIDEVHMLTLPAFNALLKTLEEPPAHVKFIFATTEPHKVPVTILSRCQRFEFRRIPLLDIIAQLRKICLAEDIKISDEGLNLIAKQSEGSMRDAEGLLDQVVSSLGTEIEAQEISNVLGLIDRELVFNMAKAALDADQVQCLRLVEEIYARGHDVKAFYKALMTQFRDLLIALVAPKSHILDLADEEMGHVSELANKVGIEKVQAMLELLIKREEDLRFASQPRIVLETILIRLCNLGDLLSFGKILEKLESLEKRLVEDTKSISKSQSDPPLSGKDTTNSRKGWEEFVQFVGKRNKAMSNILKGWRFLGFDAGLLRLERGQEPFSSAYFDDKERLNELATYARKFFQGPVEIRIEERKGIPPEVKAKEKPGLSRPIKDLLDVFEGKIVE